MLYLNYFNFFHLEQHFNELWTQTPSKRFECGKALIELTLKQEVKHVDGNLIHTFLPARELSLDHISFEVGQYVIISTLNRIAITTGTISSFKEDCVEVSLERYLLLLKF